MTLFSERQLKNIRQVPFDERIVHIDASGGFVNVSKKTGFAYSRFLNYIMLMKDVRIRKSNNLVIGEMVCIKGIFHKVCNVLRFFFVGLK